MLRSYLFCIVFVLASCSCANRGGGDDTQGGGSIEQIAKQRIENYILSSLVDSDGASISNVSVEFKGNNVIVLSCRVIANNRFGGKVQNIFEYIYTSYGEEKLDNVSAGSTTYSRARALASTKCDYYSDEYNQAVEKEIMDILRLGL